MERTIKCRKCGGAHLTIKCGKINEPINIDENVRDNNFNNDNKFNNKFNNDNRFNKVSYKVKITNLPKDFEYHEISEFIKDWGYRPKVNIKSYDDYSLAVVEFKNVDEQDYFVKALDGTSFDHVIIKVIKLD